MAHVMDIWVVTTSDQFILTTFLPSCLCILTVLSCKLGHHIPQEHWYPAKKYIGNIHITIE